MLEKYDPKKIESHWYVKWEQAGYFKPSGNGSSYCIMLPPPNITGSLHMGHAFQQTLMDTLIRYHRMKGNKTLWQVGTDHASIATQMIVERQLNAEGISRHDIGREVFVERVWKWKEESGGNITKQLRRLGSSVDWSKERFTLDEKFSEAVLKVFIQLYDEGLIYRGKRLVNWDPVLLTALSDLEVESKEEDGFLWHIRYPLESGDGHVTVATTRPETLLGDVAVAVHPEDERYAHLVGKKLKLPLTDRLIPIITDDSVLKDFGSGCVKITPAHDFNDYAMGERHQLPKINIFTLDAKLNENTPKEYQGMDRFQARDKMVQDLSEFGLLEKVEKHKLMIPRGDRSGAILEPLLTDQWYVKIAPLAEPAIKVVEEGKIRFVPENWDKTYFSWMNNIQDWCISRQLWWGHRIPAWYDDAGNIYVAMTENLAREKYQLDPNHPLHQDSDVLDTWFSAALWPFATLGWPEKTEDLQSFYPTDVLITGFDIIFFWVARMIMFGLKFTDQIPFHTVYINALILDQNGQKMSKTKGNVLDPLDLIDGITLPDLIQKRIYGLMQPHLADDITKKTHAEFPDGIPSYGTDPLRFTFFALATPARFIRFETHRVEGYRHFCNKIWNAARFVLLNTEGKELGSDTAGARTLSLPDHWILSLWQETKKRVHQYLGEYRFDLAAQALYEFTWNEYCDWYLELSKPILNNPDASKEEQQGTRFTLLKVLEELLRVLHPAIPYITEEIWQAVAPLLNIQGNDQDNSIMMQPYPEHDETLVNISSEKEIEWLKSFILGVRNIRGEMNISPSKKITVYYQSTNPEDLHKIQNQESLLRFLAKIESFNDAKTLSSHQIRTSATTLIGDLKVYVPIDDIEGEKKRLQKEIEKLSKDIDKRKIKLDNPNFAEKAPADLVKQEEALQKDSIEKMKKLSEILALLEESGSRGHPAIYSRDPG